MLKARTRWQLATCDEALSEQIARECGISPLLARMLVIRGITTPENAHAFLNISVDQFHDPFLMDGMAESVERIRFAIEKGEPICIYGDYDADGVSSTSLMVHLMRQLGATFDYYIPNRFKEGYGLNNNALSYIHEQGFKLVVTVDTGISAVEQVAHGQGLGLDIIVTDHHEPPAIIPDAFAVMNPKKETCQYPFDMLAGVGVAFKLGHALLGQPPMHLADLAAIGTIADLVPLVDENRLLASFGLKQLNRTRNIGLQALIRVCGLAEKEIGAGNVGFAIGPRINAVGRLETAEAAVKLLTSDDQAEADKLAQTLDDLNTERQELVQRIAEEAEAMVLEQFPPESNNVLVLAKEDWNVGVVGIVASRMVEKFYRPTIVLGIDPEKGTAKGSARSINGFDMYDALTDCKELLPHYGGHTMAAGMTLPVENLAPLRDRLNQLAAEWLGDEDYIPLTKVDLEVPLDQLDITLAQELDALAPFGMGNPTPLVTCPDVSTSGLRKIGRDDSHLKCVLTAAGTTIDAIGFGYAHVTEHLTPSARLHVVGELQVNEWNGNVRPQLMLKDLAVLHRQVFDWRGIRDKEQRWRALMQAHSCHTITFERDNYERLTRVWGAQGAAPALELITAEESLWLADDLTGTHRTLILYDLPRSRQLLTDALARVPHIERIYCLFGDPDLSFDGLHFPSKDQFKFLYTIFRQYTDVQKVHLDALAKKIKVKRDIVERMLAVFMELQFIIEQESAYSLNPAPAKAALESSRLYSMWQEETQLATDLLLSSHEALSKTLLNTPNTPVQEAIFQ
ncbi:single-stranded-DNA-specific exonuclease RecJ [Brevibacillus dissolubilis]|uniref:single-stranded-DNA-specific exonuclease RecJ n=1 Tax=Brevibacillus dissolubilis TaxID=1844116 RepID=UPI001115CED2|nr:single-stranded-DNA-specific exonuclease RecJ [Brevibacillus dissolubilis]